LPAPYAPSSTKEREGENHQPAVTRGGGEKEKKNEGRCLQLFHRKAEQAAPPVAKKREIRARGRKGPRAPAPGSKRSLPSEKKRRERRSGRKKKSSKHHQVRDGSTPRESFRRVEENSRKGNRAPENQVEEELLANPAKSISHFRRKRKRKGKE